MSTYEPDPERLSQRELRNESGRLFRALGEGQSFVLTHGGAVVGRIVPECALARRLRIAQPARRYGGWAALAIERKTIEDGSDVILGDSRGDRY